MTSTIQCVVVGDRGVGKTSMIISYKNNEFPTENAPIVIDNYTVNVMVDEEQYTLFLYDIEGQPENDQNRILCYTIADVILICFSVVDPSSLDNIKKKWLKEIKPYYRSTTPYLLVGTQIDLRDDTAIIEALAKNKQKPFESSDGQKLAEGMGAYKYLECSTLNKIGLNDVFVEAILAAIKPPQNFPIPPETDRKKKCCCF